VSNQNVLFDPEICQKHALEAEQNENWAGALYHWERLIDRCDSAEEQRVETRQHISN